MAFRDQSRDFTQLPNRILCALSVILAPIALCASSAYAQRIAPDESWRTLDTEHFRVTFPAHLEDMGRRAAERAEWAHARLSEQFIAAPRGMIDLVLTDHIDTSNGFATPWPSNRITIYARPPIDSFGLAYFDDWLENIIAHELTHIFHIDRPSRYSWLYKPFGQVPVLLSFPALTTPTWNTEGIATWYESALTGTGRVRGTFHKMVLRTAAPRRAVRVHRPGGWQLAPVAGGHAPLCLRIALLRTPDTKIRTRPHDRLCQSSGKTVDPLPPQCRRAQRLWHRLDERVESVGRYTTGSSGGTGHPPRQIWCNHRARGTDPRCPLRAPPKSIARWQNTVLQSDQMDDQIQNWYRSN